MRRPQAPSGLLHFPLMYSVSGSLCWRLALEQAHSTSQRCGPSSRCIGVHWAGVSSFDSKVLGPHRNSCIMWPGSAHLPSLHLGVSSSNGLGFSGAGTGREEAALMPLDWTYRPTSVHWIDPQDSGATVRGLASGASRALLHIGGLYLGRTGYPGLVTSV